MESLLKAVIKHVVSYYFNVFSQWMADTTIDSVFCDLFVRQRSALQNRKREPPVSKCLSARAHLSDTC